jgi:hypothetical protein
MVDAVPSPVNRTSNNVEPDPSAPVVPRSRPFIVKGVEKVTVEGVLAVGTGASNGSVSKCRKPSRYAV